MSKEIDEKDFFERILKVYLNEDFTKKSTYFDEELKREFDYQKITEYLEKYFRNNIVEEEKILLFHEKRVKLDFKTINIIKYKNEFYKFIEGDLNFINHALVYVERYANKTDLENYKNALIKYHEKYIEEFRTYEDSGFSDKLLKKSQVKIPVMLLFREYLKYVLKETLFIYKRKKSLTTSKCYVTLNKILKSNDLQVLANEIYSKDLTKDLDLSRTYDFAFAYKEIYNLTNEEVEKLYQKLSKKVREFRKYLNELIEKDKLEQEKEIEERYEKERLPLCNKLITEYLNSEFTSMQLFCKKHEISYERFKKDIEVVKKHNLVLYNKLIETVKKQQAERYMSLKNRVQKFVEKLIHGIELENGKIRDFDIIDYYLTTNIRFDQLLEFAKNNLDDESLRLVRKFIKKYHYGRILIKKDILMERNIIIINDNF